MFGALSEESKGRYKEDLEATLVHNSNKEKFADPEMKETVKKLVEGEKLRLKRIRRNTAYLSFLSPPASPHGNFTPQPGQQPGRHRNHCWRNWRARSKQMAM